MEKRDGGCCCTYKGNNIHYYYCADRNRIIIRRVPGLQNYTSYRLLYKIHICENCFRNCNTAGLGTYYYNNIIPYVALSMLNKK